MLSTPTALSISQLGCTILLLALANLVWQAAYNVVFHPLRKYPGPVSHAISRVPIVIWLWRGRLAYHLEALHSRYGEVVRIAPNELSFINAAAWKDIYGRRVELSGHQELPKWQRFYRVHSTRGQTTIFNADIELHALLRRQLAVGFSERSMHQQQGIIGGYVDLLIQGLRESQSSVIDMTKWYVWATFDIIGDLALGSSFGCLGKRAWHPWVWQFVSSPREFTFISGLRMLRLDWLATLVLSIGMPTRKRILAMTTEALKQRVARGETRLDLVQGLLVKSEQEVLDFQVIHGTARSLIFAGSETTATLLCGVTFLLLKHPTVLEKAKSEVRLAFASEKDITLLSVSKLVYMLACLNEALRLYPPVPVGLPRCVPSEGVVIAGYHVPADTIVSIPHVAMYRSPIHWTKPTEYVPERFLGSPEFCNDNLEALQPFSVGPRNCLGKTLAFSEMRLILARMLFSFNLELCADSLDWLHEQETYLLWHKPPLNVRLVPKAQ